MPPLAHLLQMRWEHPPPIGGRNEGSVDLLEDHVRLAASGLVSRDTLNHEAVNVIFHNVDRDRSGTLEAPELRTDTFRHELAKKCRTLHLAGKDKHTGVSDVEALQRSLTLAAVVMLARSRRSASMLLHARLLAVLHHNYCARGSARISRLHAFN